MKSFSTLFLFAIQLFFSQNIASKLDAETKIILNSSSAYSANLSIYVAEENGDLVYEYNGNKGLSTASTQKIFSAAAALETLGKNYTYNTTASYSGKIEKEILEGNLFIKSNGDPTLGSWRYDGYKPEDFKKALINSIKNKNITKIEGNLIIDDSYFDFQTIPGGYPWDDLGNYYGSGVWSVNWRENQFDMYMVGSEIKGFNIPMEHIKWVSEVKTGGSSDNSLVFTAPHSGVGLINGTLPANKKYTVSGSIPNPPLALALEIKNWLKEAGIEFQGELLTNSNLKIEGKPLQFAPENSIILNYKSPTLDKIVYYFLQKSVNLYGETFIKTMAKEKRREGSFKEGVDYLQDFWKSKGINSYMINFADGSGLSPQNYVSAKAEVQALLYAKKQTWFEEYWAGFPTQNNGMKMKSGTIRNCKSFAGYQTSKSGKKYVFAVIVNNYQGGNVSAALYDILNNLK
ncbi:D-alanyl-D-alanine carboxypeptidase/D-alanyl-D-alanine endopeptidase [Frigoriflavimonas asaccharolytica]|uniref:D-alanyl-D-alanine carboxypeptidase/D-alanyl-D-alanine-endopeptidase (Penicillin-binding protein 4) n=1 Tax=Frigoriflavimonas asaccharolytica TaxID=2735899 RepID=A0A8J8G5U2_9FLAO|nr:D-alanyl-D-alanine carboxypeptidase/D-alanyl-D-alanine-endopeptidase [Frigoriflavimonas asaccharolytica]NRS91779.1 D-alanyl-D-alanine carboxypeptidase/D-alanyl-D-alanine-endopeptidase (penicillin-binding protein 4) [Frigoriflavimonas asaccharolytica]